LGKFFDAMQRAAAASKPEVAEADPPQTLRRQPDLDEALLTPENDASDIFRLPGVDDKESGLLAANSPSAVIRTLESEIRETRSTRTVRISSAEHIATKPAQKSVETDPSFRIVNAEPQSGSSMAPRPVGGMRVPDPTGVRVHPAYDRIVQRLISYRRSQRQSTVLVSSAVAGEGASTVARNLATALSHSGTEQVLLVDANLRTPVQHVQYAVERELGFSDVLRGEANLASVIRGDVGSGISLMTCGSLVKSPTQVVTVSAVQGVVMALLSLYDWIIVDGPPTTVYPDAGSLGSACAAAILVVRAESTRSEVAREAKAVLEGTGADLLGAVLNRRRFHIPSIIYRKL
jgi:capsular exopolysaccharide synthesis family protein